MKRFLFLSILLVSLIKVGPLYAPPLGRNFSNLAVPNPNIQVGNQISPMTGQHNPQLPINCREETCHSSPDPVSGIANCHRYICGGNWWGDSAIDVVSDGTEVTEGTGGNQSRYQTWQIRKPIREYSNDPWYSIRVYTSGVRPFYVSGTEFRQLMQGLGLTAEKRNFLSDFLLRNAFADARSFIPWSQEERDSVANEIHIAAIALQAAIENGNTAEVGAPGSEQRFYFDEALRVANFAAHMLAPNLFPYCGGSDDLCHAYSNPNNFEIKWDTNFTLHGIGGYTVTALLDGNLLTTTTVFPSSDRLQDHPDHLYWMTQAVLHEATHIDNARSLENSFFSNQDAVARFADETTAMMTQIILSHFVNAAPGSIHLSTEVDHDHAYYDLLKNNVGIARMGLMREHVPALRAIADSLGISPIEFNKFFGLDHDLPASAWTTGIGFSGVQILEDDFKKGGGVVGLLTPNATPSQGMPMKEIDFSPPNPSLHPSLHSDNMNTLHSAPGTPSGLTVGPAPAQGSNTPLNNNIGHQPNLPGYTPPPLSNRVPMNVAAGRPGDTAFDAWCRTHRGGGCNPPTPSGSGGGGSGSSPSGCRDTSGNDCGGGGGGASSGGSGGPFNEGAGGGGGGGGSSACPADVCISTSP